MAKRAAVQEINEIIEKRQQKLNKNMTIKQNWDMNVDIKRLQKEVEDNPKVFYDNFED
jgi:hypothetical protein